MPACAQTFDSTFIKSNLLKNKYEIDTEAAAVILLDEKYIEIMPVPGLHGLAFRVEEHIHKIIKFLRSSSLGEANVKIICSGNAKDNTYEIKGTTYNYTGSDVVKTGINKTDVYLKEINSDKYELDFSFPEVKVGSVLEYSYDLYSPVGLLLPKWEIQEEFPKLVSTYKVSCPGNFAFTTISHVGERCIEYPSVENAFKSPDSFCYVNTSENALFGLSNFWLRRNVPAVRQEPYVQNPSNYRDNLILQLTAFMSGNGLKRFDDSWEKLNQEMLKSDRFACLKNNNFFLDELIDSITRSAPFLPDTRKAIYKYVRANFTCAEEYDIFTKRSLLDIYRSRQGSNAEINLLLCTMLLHAGIDAAPIILGTTGHISPTTIFPVLDRFNYLACAVNVDGGYIMLDASDKNNIYGSLPVNCYNGYARIIKKEGIGVTLTSSVLKDKTIFAVKIFEVTDTSAKVEINQKMGLIRSSVLRKEWAKNEKAKKEYLDDVEQGLPMNCVISETIVAHQENPDTNLFITFSGKIKLDSTAGTLFINADWIKNIRQNPFSATTRTMPVEFPYLSQFQYHLNISLPASMEPVDIPATSSISMDSSAMTYEKIYTYFQDMHTLTVNSSFNVNTPVFPTDDYDKIRSFFQNMMKRENEIVTLKKSDKK